MFQKRANTDVGEATLMQLRGMILIAVSCLLSTVGYSQNSKTANVRVYELYSWQAKNDGWRFRLLPSPSGRNIYPEEVFKKGAAESGVRNVKRALKKLPKGTSVIWLDRIDLSTVQGQAGIPHLGYPPQGIIQEIQRYADDHGITVEVSAGEAK